MYQLLDLGRMSADPVRMAAYAQALQHHVKPGCTVLDLGAGAGIMSLLACRFGAQRVFAVETGDAIHVMRELAQRNGMADRIVCLHANSMAVELPQRVDVIVADLRGTLPVHPGALEAIVDARSRFLKPSGALIPRKDVLRCALVSSPRPYDALQKPWRDNEYGFDMEPARRLLENVWWSVRLTSDELLPETATLGAIDYSCTTTADFRGDAQLENGAPAQAYGVCVWFDAELAPGIGFSNAPGQPPAVYGQAFFPWPECVALDAGDRVSFELRPHAHGGSHIWSWRTRIDGPGGAREFRQSTFFGAPLDPASLKRRAATHVAQLGARGRADLLALQLIDQGLPLGDVALQLHARFPADFTATAQALTHVADLAERYCR
jgi:protein arginine N-methyltransferase 1